MNKRYKKAWLRMLAGVCGNITAGWFGLAFITPNFVNLSNTDGVIVLTRDVLLGIVFLLIGVLLERKSL